MRNRSVVEWAVEIFNQHQQAVALYSILTLVARQQGDFAEATLRALTGDVIYPRSFFNWQD
jgi:hypothetical protein